MPKKTQQIKSAVVVALALSGILSLVGCGGDELSLGAAQQAITPKVPNVGKMLCEAIEGAVANVTAEINGATVPVACVKHGTTTMGHNSVSELTLVAYYTPSHKALSEGMNKMMDEWRHQANTITITEKAKDGTPIKTFVYDQCLLTSLDYPNMDSHSGEVLCMTCYPTPSIVTL